MEKILVVLLFLLQQTYRQKKILETLLPSTPLMNSNKMLSIISGEKGKET